MYWPLNSGGLFNPVAKRDCINGCIKTVLSRKIKTFLSSTDCRGFGAAFHQPSLPNRAPCMTQGPSCSPQREAICLKLNHKDCFGHRAAFLLLKPSCCQKASLTPLGQKYALSDGVKT